MYLVIFIFNDGSSCTHHLCLSFQLLSYISVDLSQVLQMTLHFSILLMCYLCLDNSLLPLIDQLCLLGFQHLQLLKHLKSWLGSPLIILCWMRELVTSFPSISPFLIFWAVYQYKFSKLFVPKYENFSPCVPDLV